MDSTMTLDGSVSYLCEESAEHRIEGVGYYGKDGFFCVGIRIQCSVFGAGYGYDIFLLMEWKMCPVYPNIGTVVF